MSRRTMISVCWEVCYASPRDTPSTTPISPSSIMRLVPPEEKKGSEMPVLGMVDFYQERMVLVIANSL